MKTAFKWILIVLGIVVIAAGITAFYLKSKFENGAKRNIILKPTVFEIPDDSASLARGRVLAVMCRTCHENDYSGKAFFNDPSIGFMSSPNLTGATGSATEQYSDDDWIRALRHAINPNGKPLMVMPSETIGLLSDKDLGCLIGFMKSVNKIEKPLGPTKFTLFASVLAGAGAFGNLYPYDIIEHDKVNSISAPEKSNSNEYGAYLTRYMGCAGCHGASFNGGISPDPISPPPPNITRGGNFGKWTLDQFKETMRGGKTPEGKIMDAQFMPWAGIGAHEDVELEALYNYLKSLPELPNSKEYEERMKKMKK